MKKTKKMKQILIVFSVLLVGLALPSVAFADYYDGDPDPGNGKEGVAEKTDNAQITVDGWIGEFDPTNPGPGPNPDPGTDGWVNVTLPTSVVFGAVDVDKGNIKSPSYKITNNSIKDVKISLEDFVHGKDADKLPELNLRLETDGKLTPLVSPGSSISKYEIVTLTGAKSAVKDSVEFKFTGSVGITHDYKTTIEPQYDLVLKFEAKP